MHGEFLCGECGQNYTRRSSYRRHLREGHSGTRYECPICQKVSRKRRDALLHEHIKLVHSDVYEMVKANQEKLLKPMKTVQSGEKSAPTGVDELTAPVTQGPETTQPLPDVPPLSPGTAQVCQEILSAAGGINDLFPDNTSGYVPANVDGTFPELDQEYHPTQVATPEARIDVTQVKNIPLEAGPEAKVTDPRNSSYRAKVFQITEPDRCPHGVALPTIIWEQTIKEGIKTTTTQIRCGSCPVPAFIQWKMTTVEEKATLTEQPVFHEKAIGTAVVMMDAACDPQ